MQLTLLRSIVTKVMTETINEENDPGGHGGGGGDGNDPEDPSGPGRVSKPDRRIISLTLGIRGAPTILIPQTMTPGMRGRTLPNR